MSLLSDEDVVDILRKLKARTVDKSLEWDDFSLYEFEAHTPRFDYYIKSRDEDDEAPYILQIWRRADGSRTENLKLQEIITRPSAVYNELLGELYQEAKLAALDITSLKDAVLDDLG